jgi:Tol biopolymer transport system component/DNA-binding SARP family transcriptional activator
MNTSPLWRLSLMGHFRLEGPSGTASLTSRKAVALLAYLALQRDRASRREAVAALLWENSDPAQARATLRQAVAAIRRVEEEFAPILLADPEVLRLSDDVDVDVARIRAALRDREPETDVAELYGPGLLAGFTVRDAPAFNEWLAIEQAHIRQQIVSHLSEVAETNAEAGTDLNTGAAAALRLLAVDPYNEAGHRALMRIYARQGRAALAIAQYRSLSELLRTELQVPPEVDTQRLYEQIATSRRDRNPDRLPRPAAPEPSTAAPVPSPAFAPLEPADAAVEGGSLPTGAAPRLPEGPGPRGRLLLLGSVAGAVAIASGALTIAMGIIEWRSSVPSIARLRPLVGAEMNPDEVALSPDGAELMFSVERPDGSDLFLMDADGKGAPQPVARDDGDEEAPAWHPDGRSIAFVRHKQDTSWIVQKRLPAGNEEVVATYAGRIQSLAWSPDGKFLLASAAPGIDAAFRLMRLDLPSATWSPVPGSTAGAFRDISPRFSQDGSKVLFLRETGVVGSEIFIRDLASGAELRIAGQAGRVWSAGWSKDGRGVVYGSEQGGESNLWFLSLGQSPAKPRRLATGLHLYWALSLSASGDKLAFITSRTNPTFWKLPDDSIPGTAPVRISMLAGVGDRTPEQSITGEIVFVSSRTGEEQVWKRRVDGTLQQLTRTTGSRYDTPRWSPDGKWIAVSMIAGAPDIYVLDSTSGAVRRLTRGLAASLTSWSPDGRFLQFRREGRTYELWRVEIATGKISQITTEGGIAGAPTPDSKAFIYVKDDEVNVWRRALTPSGRLVGPPTLLVNDLAGVADVRGNSLIYLARDRLNGAKALKRFDLRTGKSSIMSRDADVLGTLNLSASPLGGVLFEKNEQQREISLIEFE